MWNMIKAEVAYDKVLFVFLYSVVTLAAAANALFGNLEESLATLMFFSIVVIGITAGIEEMRTKRIRLLAGQPVPARILGILRYPVFVVYWLSLMVMLWLSSLINQKVPVGLDYLWWILTRTGAMFIWVVCMNLSQDFMFVTKTKAWGYFLKWTVLLFGVFTSPFVYFVTNVRFQSDPVFLFLSNMFQNAAGALSLFLLSLGLMVLSVLVYERRRSYLE